MPMSAHHLSWVPSLVEPLKEPGPLSCTSSSYGKPQGHPPAKSKSQLSCDHSILLSIPHRQLHNPQHEPRKVPTQGGFLARQDGTPFLSPVVSAILKPKWQVAGVSLNTITSGWHAHLIRQQAGMLQDVTLELRGGQQEPPHL